jgi:methionyl-tRNA synthetase
MAEGLRLVATALAPVMPSVSEQILERLGCATEVDWREDLNWGDRLKGNGLGKKIILFPRHR